MPWALPGDEAGLLALATDYPYAAPDESYLFALGEARGLSAAGWRGYDFGPRVPVLAHGSNRSPQQLFRKFGRDAEIPVTYGRLAGFDVVYAAHVARMLALMGTAADQARLDAVQVVALETRMAKAHMNVVERRDPDKTWNRKTLAEFQSMTPNPCQFL